MPVSKRRTKKTSSSQKKVRPPKSTDLVLMKHPFSKLPQEVLLKELVEIGKTHQDEFPSRLAAVEALLRSKDPLITISMLATYGLTGSIDENGHFNQGYKGEEFNQSHVELAQALCLRVPPSECSHGLPGPDIIQKLFDLLPELGSAFHLRRLVQLQEERSDEARAVMLIQEELRLHTQGVRNWGFLGRVAEITRRLCAPLDDMFFKVVGISATGLINLFFHLIRRHERLENERRLKLRPAFRATTVEGMIKEYHNSHPNLRDSTAEMIAFARKERVSKDYMKYLILSHSDLSLSDICTINVTTLAAEIGIEELAIESGLGRLGISLGGLNNSNPEHFFLTNPVWTKPVIQLGEGKYFCAIPQVFFSFVFPALTELISDQESSVRVFERRRAEFLESDIKNLFAGAFSNCDLAAGFKWREGSDQYESDLIVRVDSHLILVEAKSHSISWQALRGAPDRARKHVKEMLLDPSIQSLRLATRVKEVLADRSKKDALLPNFPVSLDEVRTVLRLSVTLEDFATFQTTLHHAKKAGWIPSDHPIAPCILLADLEIVFDILESTSHKIHYLKRRADLEANFDYKGDELDLLGFYLNSGFNVGEAEYSKDHFMLVGMSKPIDRYYMALEEEIVTSKPKPMMTQWWRDICAKIETRGFRQWTDVANLLLNVSFQEQEQLARGFKKVAKNVQKNWRVPEHNCAVIMIPHGRRTEAVAIVAFKERNYDDRHDRMKNVAAEVFGSAHVESCVVIGVNIDQMHYPYSLVAVFFAPADSVGSKSSGAF